MKKCDPLMRMAASSELRTPDYESSAGAVFSEMVRDQLDQERRRKDSLEQRGIAVITSAGVLVALLLGIAGIVDKSQVVGLPDLVKVGALLALLLFAAAAVLGLFVNWAFQYDEPKADQIKDVMGTKWNAPAAGAAKFVAESYLTTVKSYRKRGDRKASLLLWALGLEAAAIVVLALAVADFVLVALK
jgi:hypothetical protein